MLPITHILPTVAAATVLLVAYGRWRTDVVAVAALLAAVLGGAIPVAAAFDGLAGPTVPTVALLAVMAAAIRNSGVVETLAGALRPLLRWGTARVAVFGTVGAVLSASLGNRSVLSWMVSSALQGVRRSEEGNVPILLPISLLALLGGLLTAVGTLPNLLLPAIAPGRFELFSFLPTGLPTALAGLLVIAVAWRFLPQAQALVRDGAAAPQVESYTSEVVVPPGSPLVGQTVRQLELRSEGTVTLKGIVRETFRRIEPRADWAIEADDVLVLACQPLVLQRLMERTGLSIVGGTQGVLLDSERVGVVEAIVTPASELAGRSPAESGLGARQISLLGIGRSGRQPPGRLRRTKLQAGDVLMLQGELATLPGTLATLGCLTLAERQLRLGRRRRVLAPLALLVATLALAATGTVPLVIGLLGAVLLLVLLRGITLDELYAVIPWPVLVTVAALLPLATALRDGPASTTAANLLAPFLLLLAPKLLPPLVLLLCLLVTPLLGGIVTLLLSAPFLLAAAARLGLPPEPLLVAAALGASCEFVTLRGQGFAPTLPGHERPRQAWRLLMPLYAAVLGVGATAILLAWPLP